jgi:hypothetical protein
MMILNPPLILGVMVGRQLKWWRDWLGGAFSDDDRLENRRSW